MLNSFPANWSQSTRPYLPVYFTLAASAAAAAAATFATIVMPGASDATATVVKSYSG